MPELAAKVGHDIVTSSGDTLLGADDKAGVAEIMAAVAHLAAHPELPRPTLRVSFTPDEEIGEGATLFNIDRFGALCAYTMDGSEIGEFTDETFSAQEMIVSIRGVDVHPGHATGKLVSALRLAADIVAALPSDRLTPGHDLGPRGLHPRLRASAGPPATAEIRAIVRDFDEERLAEHVALFEDTAREVMARAPRATLDMSGAPAVPQHAPVHRPGARSWSRRPRRRSPRRVSSPCGCRCAAGPTAHACRRWGLPTPNIFTGGHEYHSVREWASVHDMASAAATVVRLAEVWTRPEWSERAGATH